MKSDNTITRLKESIILLQASNQEFIKKQKNASIFHVLIDAYELENDNVSEALRNWALLNDLNKLAQERIERIDNISDFHTRPFNTLSTAFKNTNLTSPFNNIKAKFEGETMTSLKFCEDLVMRDNIEDIDYNDIKNLKEDLEEFMNNMFTYELESEIHKFVYNQLAAIQKVLHHYNLFGIDGLERIFDQVVGTTIKKYHSSEKFRDSKIKNDFWGILSKINTFIGLTTASPILIEEITKLLLS